MRYLCVHCDLQFDFEGEEIPRCPKCMRVHDIREYSPVAEHKTRPVWPWIAALALLMAATAGGGYLWWRSSRGPASTGSRSIPLKPLEKKVLAEHLQRLGVEAGDLTDLLQLSDGIEKFSKAITSGKKTPRDKALAVVEALRERASKRAFVRWPMLAPRETPPMPAYRVLEAIKRDGAERQLYPLEVAALAVAALRAAEVPAMLAEVYALCDERAPLDPSGRIGYFALQAAYGGRDGAGELLDPYGGRSCQPKPGDFQVLTDVQAVGAALSLRALYRSVRARESQEAIAEADAAQRLAPRSATGRGARGAILLANGVVEQGQAEFEAAAQLRPDAPRRNNLAILSLIKGDLERANREVVGALGQYRDYAEAHATLASLHVVRSEFDLARSELETAGKLEPNLPILPTAWAQFFAAQGQINEAIYNATRGAQMQPYDSQVRLLLAQLYYQAARYDDMRREARAALELVPLSQKEEARQLIGRMLGPTALEEPSGAALQGSSGPSTSAAATAGDLKLGEGLRLMDQPEGVKAPGAPTGGGVGKERASGESTPLLLLREPTKLRLRDTDSKLKLTP